MIDFRYHIVSIVAIFIALAVGIVLGSGPLKDDISGFLEARTNQLASQKVELQDEVGSLRDDLEASEQYAQLTEPALLNGLLLTQPVVLIELPEAAEDASRRVQEAIDLAGGELSARVRIEPAWTDPAEADALARLAEDWSGGREGDGTYDLAAQVLAGALVTDNARLAGTTFLDTADILSEFEDAGFLKADQQDVVLGGSAILIGSDSTNEAANTTLLPIVDWVDADGEGTVVAGPIASASEGGVVALVRGGDLVDRVSTLDRVETTIGTTVTVMALIDQREGKVGQYGTGENSEGIAPDPVPGS